MEQTLKRVGAFEKRVHEIDFVRGFLILLVTMDHLFWALAHYNGIWYGVTHQDFFLQIHNTFQYYWNSNAREFVRYVALFGFVFVSGISIGFSRNTYKRSAIMIVFWGVLAVGSNLLNSLIQGNNILAIDFNIIGIIAWCSLIYSIFAKRSNKIMWVLVLLGFLIWWYLIPNLRTSHPEIVKTYIPIFWDPIYSGHPQADWLPLFPYIIFFFLGVLFSRTFYSEKRSYFKRHEFERPICFFGRHTLIIYIGWEALLLAVFEFANLFVK